MLTYRGITAPPPPGRVRAPAAALPAELEAGREVFETQGCAACHQIGGVGGAAGPDLSKVGAARDAAWLERFIREPQSVKPDSPMPPYGTLPAQQLEALVRYLSSLK